jgi:Spy/CpxP family protein refolding chaperone
MRQQRWVMGVMAGLVAMALAVGTGYADAGCGKGKGEGGWQHAGHLDEIFFHKSHMMLRHEEALGLSEEQVERIQVIMGETQKRLIRDEADIDVLGVDLMRELRKPAIDVQAARSILDKQYEAKKAKASALVQSLADLKATLTPEQYAKLKELYRAEKE